MKDCVIKVKDLRKVYKVGTEKVVALNKINLEIYRGEICCILGTSGSGKSTLLNMMAGLEKPTKGTIEIKNNAIDVMTEKQLAGFRQKYIGFIFQSYNLLTALTAL
ncbi:MAG TPA: macrolide ABC transporter ATP-binding protein, partial [Clostridiales bacterium UBA8960]|nr:macrolide ABC transporter ATP-binding protein [Clostridiales bacterium UBA8960]